MAIRRNILLAQMVMLSSMLAAQAVPSADPRSPEALAIVAKSLAAMTPPGSTLTGADITSLQASGAIDSVDSTGAWVSGTFTYTEDLDHQRPEYKRSVVFNGKTHELTSNHGSPSSTRGRAEAKDASAPHRRFIERKFEADYLPYILLYQASVQTGTAIYAQGSSQIDGKTYLHLITMRDEHRSDAHRPNVQNEKIRHDWYLDPETMLPFMYMELIPAVNPAQPWAWEKITFSSYQPVAGLLCPMEQTVAFNSMEIERIHVKSLTTNVQVQAATFDAPAGN
jgi:hypothetical protein